MVCPKCKLIYKGDYCPNCVQGLPKPPKEERDSSVIYGIIAVAGVVLLVALLCVMMLQKLIQERNSTQNLAEYSPDAMWEDFSRTDHGPADWPEEPHTLDPADLESSVDEEQAMQDWQNASGIYNSGDYKVGRDVPAGTYLILSDGLGGGEFYYGLYVTAAMSDAGQICGGWADSSVYVVLEEGQFLHFSHAKMYDASKVEIPLDPFRTPGMFLVGKDMEPGTYTVICNDEQYGGTCTIYASLTASGGITRFSQYLEGKDPLEIELAEGEYLQLERCILQS